MKITSIFLFMDGGCTVAIEDEGSTSKIEIKVTAEALKGKSLDERYEHMKTRAEKYISCAIEG